MPTPSQLRADKQRLEEQLARRVDPATKLAQTNASLAIFELLNIRLAAAPELLASAADLEGAGDSRRQVLKTLCERWWSAVWRELVAVFGEVPDEALALHPHLLPEPSDVTFESVRDFIEPRARVLAELLAR